MNETTGECKPCQPLVEVGLFGVGEAVISLHSCLSAVQCGGWRGESVMGSGSYASFVREENRVDDGSRENEACGHFLNHRCQLPLEAGTRCSAAMQQTASVCGMVEA